MIKIAKRNNNWRYKYPPCPKCKGTGEKGLTLTHLGNSYNLKGQKIENKCLRCQSCNAMYICEWDKDNKIKVGKSLGD